jgi:ribonuclease HI
MQQVKIYTDGACKGNPGKGGWAALLIAGDARKEISGGRTYTTNNEMELMAIVEAMEAMKYSDKEVYVTIFTDSKLAIGWITGDYKMKKPHIVDLVTYIRELASTKSIKMSFQHVKGHNGDPLNERVDYLASQAAERS